MYLLLFFFFFFFNDTATTEIYTLSLHDALPISPPPAPSTAAASDEKPRGPREAASSRIELSTVSRTTSSSVARSEEHTSELQSHVNLVCRLLLEKKKTITTNVHSHDYRDLHLHA